MPSAIIEAPSYAPSVAPEIQQELLEMSPPVFLRWRRGTDRWELWCKLEPSRHPDASNELADADRWNTDHQCWMRFLQVYQTAEREFAHADRALIRGLEMADGWSSRRFYEENIEEPEERAELAEKKRMRGLAGDVSKYYHGIPNPIVAPYSKAGKADWRQGSMY